MIKAGITGKMRLQSVNRDGEARGEQYRNGEGWGGGDRNKEFQLC